MAIEKMPIALFVKQLGEAFERGDGYIMGATGQNPRRWKVDSWWFTQYDKNPRQKEKALYWRAHAQRVWDCNGLAEGLYRDYTGVDINDRARYNYAHWCDPRGAGLIPPSMRVPGAAVFWGDSASDIHHVAFLYKPVRADEPGDDWYLIEARGVMTGVVETRLLSRKPNYWGWMTKYFDYERETDAEPRLGDRTLRNGDEGADVKELQTDLIRLGYDCGRWGADGDFGDATEQAVRSFQKDKRLEADGVVGKATVAALEKALHKMEKPVANPEYVSIEGGNCFVRAEPNVRGTDIGIAHAGERYAYLGESTQDGWHRIDFRGHEGWVSGKYGKLVK